MKLDTDNARFLSRPSFRAGSLIGSAVGVVLGLAFMIQLARSSSAESFDGAVWLIVDLTQPVSWLLPFVSRLNVGYTPYWIFADIVLFGLAVGSIAGMTGKVLRWNHWSWPLLMILVAPLAVLFADVAASYVSSP